MKFSAVSALALAAVASATHTVTVTPPPGPTPIPSSQCNTGDLHCCNTVQSANSLGISTLLHSLGIDVDPINALVGLTCSPIIGSGGCSASPVCCQHNDWNGLVNIGCFSVTL